MTELQHNEKGISILVTGATGTVGSELVKQLTSPSPSSGIRVRAAIHSQNKVEEFRRNNKTVEIVIMELSKPQTVADGLKGIDKLFWLTLPRPNITEEISSNLVREAKKNEVRRIVKLSVLEFVGTIGRWHRYEEKTIEESGIPYTFLRAGAFMQNFISLFGQTIKNQNAFYLPAGNGKVSFIDVRDIAAVAVKLLLTENGTGHRNTAIDITGQEALSYRQAAEILSKVTGKRISYIDIPQEVALKSMKGLGMEDWLIADFMEFHSIIRAGKASQTTDTVEQILGRKATSFEQFVRDHVNSFN
jgi:uncharacterized protein YbjT (DUF2867 family)